MAARPADALDEIVWRSPIRAQQMQGIHSNSVLHYFAESPFFDPTSNNAVLMSQALYSKALEYIVQTREAFEGRLKTMSGLEFIVAQEPAEMAPGTGTGVWVIRKQTRRKRQGQEDEVTVHSTYFVMGENIYMAPAVGDVIGSRLLSIFSSLQKAVDIAASLPNFSPSIGHTYLPPPTSTRLKASEAPLGRGSKENTPLPEALNGNKKALPANASTSTFLESRLLDESFNLTIRYGDEYMDENPITGHPGEFHLSSTGRKPKDNLLVPPTGKNALSAQKTAVPPTPEPKTIDVSSGRKGSKGDKSPKTPGMPKPKRRKSKGVSGGSITPS